MPVLFRIVVGFGIAFEAIAVIGVFLASA